MLIGREHELKKLESLYNSNQFEFVVFYGRRRVGKTTLINELTKNKQAVYYMAIEGTRKENLSGLSKVLLSIGSEAACSELTDYNNMLNHIDGLCKKQERITIAIDEFPYLVASYPAISSMFQSHIDQCWENSKLFLILYGSSMSFMEEQVLGYKSPLYGRRTAQFKIYPFISSKARSLLLGFSDEDQTVLYGVTGGIPEYLLRIKCNESLDRNIINSIFDESGRLFEEPINLLKQELKKPASCHSIISAMASGASRLNDISTKVGLETSGCSNQIPSLISLGIVRKEIPITEHFTSRKTLYQLEDSMFLFWYRFVRSSLSSITWGVDETIYNTLVEPQINNFTGRIFENIYQQYLFHHRVYGTLPFAIGNVGRWWGNNPKKKCREEVDIMAAQDLSVLFGEYEWGNAPVDMDVVHVLIERGELFQSSGKHYMPFSKNGFTQSVIDYAEDKNNKMGSISYDQICELE